LINPKGANLSDDNQNDNVTLCHDMACILIECHRDRQGDGVFRQDAKHSDITELAALLARRLAPRIGGM